MRHRTAIVAGLAAVTSCWIYLSFEVLSCPESCLLDYEAMHGAEVGNFELPDARLNAWILGWVQHAGLENPTGLFDANAFHPARNTLAGSEHMIGNALILLPVRLFTDSAIALHQIALALSFLLLGWTVFAFVFWAGQSSWAAVLAGIAAMYMPWRYSEVSHLQLMSVQWIPLIWLLTGRMLLGEASRRHVIALAAVLGLQMLTSFYLAYYTLFSTGCFAAAVAWRARPPVRTWLHLATAFALPSLALVALALPYLNRFSAYRFESAKVIPSSTPPGLVLSFLAPSPGLLADTERLRDVAYFIPLVVFALACVPFARRIRALRPPEPVDTRIRTLAPGLAAAVVGAFVLMLGRDLAIGDIDVPILSTLFAKVLPGFGQMRAEFRWGIVIGIAFPILAGIGFALLERAARERTAVRVGLIAAIGIAFAVNTPFFRLPTKAAWRDANGIEAAHRKLTEFAPGPVVELPWGFRRIHLSSFGSRYMLASSFHWNPLLNGYTAYLPESHAFLQRLAQSLPAAQTIHRLQRLTDLRWIVVHPEHLPRWERKRWAIAVERKALRLVHADPRAHIYRVPERADAGSRQSLIVSTEVRDQTLSGLARDPIQFEQARGRLLVSSPDRMSHEHGRGNETWVSLRVSNDSDEIWPGYDIQTEGLVELRYRFYDDRSAEVHTNTGALDIDLLPHSEATTRAIVRAPAIDGRFDVVFDLVQRIGDTLHPLAVPAVTREVTIEHASIPSSRMRDELKRRSADPTRVGAERDEDAG